MILLLKWPHLEVLGFVCSTTEFTGHTNQPSKVQGKRRVKTAVTDMVNFTLNRAVIATQL